MALKNRSLRSTLTTRLLLWQLSALITVGICSALIFFMDDYTGIRFDFEIPVDLAGSVIVDDAGLRLSDTKALLQVKKQSPALWYVIEDDLGRRITGGSIPDQVRPLADVLGSLDHLEILGSSSEFDGAVLSVEDSAAGDLHILYGGGQTPGVLYAAFSFSRREVVPILLVIVLLTGGLTVFVVTRVIATALSSLQAVELVASKIDIEQRGVRLPNNEVPHEVAGLVSAVNEALSRLDDGYAQKQRFLSDAAHELRTPIAILLGKLELAPKSDFNKRVLLDVHRLANMAEQLLDLQNIENSKRPSSKVDLLHLGRQTMAELAPLAINAGYDPLFESEVEIFETEGDASALERVFINLVQNAIIHGGGSGTIAMAIGADRTISVSDEGPGVPDDRRQWIFEPFHRIRPLNKGSGLGLSLVREIMRRHDGSVSVGTNPNGGAIFVLRFDKA